MNTITITSVLVENILISKPLTPPLVVVSIFGSLHHLHCGGKHRVGLRTDEAHSVVVFTVL